MRDQYVGDIGDYVKLGLLRRLKADRLGVIWYKTGGGDVNNDGRYTEYLHDPQNGKHDECLFEKLKQVVCKDEDRRIKRLEKILAGASFYGEEVKTGSERSRWFKDACEKMNGCDLVFVDPDKGLREEAGKEHISVEEVSELAKKHSLLIYHHLPRKGHEEHIEKWRGELSKMMGLAEQPRAIRAARNSSRAFFLLARKKGFHSVFKKFADDWEIFLKAKKPKRYIPHYY